MITPILWKPFESLVMKIESDERVKYVERIIEQIETIVQIENSFQLQIQRILRELSEKGIVLRNIDDIHEYLLRFPDIIDVIPLAVSALLKYFPDDQIILDMYKDPEIEDSYLVLYVRTKNYNETFFEKLEKAESEFLDYLVNKEGWIQVNTDFKLKDEV